VIALLGLVGAVVFNTIYTQLRNIEVTFLLATTSGVVFALLGDMFVIWKPTRKVGLILQDRLLHMRQNFQVHGQRSCVEWSALTGGWFLAYGYLWPNDLLVAVQFGTASGILACVFGDVAMEYVAEAERELVASLSAKLSLEYVMCIFLNACIVSRRCLTIRFHCSTQKESEFLSLPFEVQFHVASFLSPEDLLEARATCHKVNNMIRAESARFWLHASLRRNSRDRSHSRERSRSHGVRFGTGGQVRSLIYEAVTLVMPMIFGTRCGALLRRACLQCHN
jgi:hypothetical protein